MTSANQSDSQTNCVRSEESATAHKSGADKMELSKYAIRKEVWAKFEKNGLVTFPRPVRGRIPNFHGAADAAVKLAELDVFKNALYVKVNADKPQENVRILTLERGKKLLVPARRNMEAAFMLVSPEGSGKAQVKSAASRRGMLQWGKPTGLDTEIKIDLVVVGSIAVSRQGHRIGKGEGFGDLEFAVLAEIGAITSETVVATTVHDFQVFDALPETLFKEHDVPVDIIVTPTEVIEVKEKLPKPNGVLWNMLSQRKIDSVAVLKTLRQRNMAKGKDCQIKVDDTDSETERLRKRIYPIRRLIRYGKKRTHIKSDVIAVIEDRKSVLEEKIKDKKKAPRRFNRRFVRTITGTDSNDDVEVRKEKRGDMRRRRFPHNAPIQFSLRIGNISSNVRVRDLKNALAERNVKPTDITWRGHRGFAFIHFAKSKKQEEIPVLVDKIVASLQDMKIGNGKEGVTLQVEPAKPLSRSEVPRDAVTV